MTLSNDRRDMVCVKPVPLIHEVPTVLYSNDFDTDSYTFDTNQRGIHKEHVDLLRWILVVICQRGSTGKVHT